MIGRLRRFMQRDDRGSIAPLVPIVLLALFFLGGLLVDGSRDLNVRGNAQAYAEEAARAGATAVDLRSPTLKLNEDKARQQVKSYCDTIESSMNSSITVLSCGLDGDQPFTNAVTCEGVDAQIVVHARVKLQIDTTLLGMFGPRTLAGSGHASARPYEGTTAGDAC